MVSDNTRSELVARLSIVDTQLEVLTHELDCLKDNIEKLGLEKVYLNGLVCMYDKDKAWSKN